MVYQTSFLWPCRPVSTHLADLEVGLDPGSFRLHLRHTHQWHRHPRRPGQSKEHCSHNQVARSRRGILRLELGPDQASRSPHILPHIQYPILQAHSMDCRRLYHSVGRLHHISLCFHLYPRREALISRPTGAIHQPSRHLDCQRRLYPFHRLIDSLAAIPTNLGTATPQTR